MTNTWQDEEGITCAECACGEEIYQAEVPGGRVVWFHSESGTPACREAVA